MYGVRLLNDIKAVHDGKNPFSHAVSFVLLI